MKRSLITRSFLWLAPIVGLVGFVALIVLIFSPDHFNVLNKYNGVVAAVIAIAALLMAITSSTRISDDKLNKDAERLRSLKRALECIKRSIKVEIFYLNHQTFVSERRSIFDVDESHLQIAIANMGRYSDELTPLIYELESDIDCMRCGFPPSFMGLPVQVNIEERKEKQLMFLNKIHGRCQDLISICDKKLVWL